MIGDGALRGEQEKNKVDRLVVYSFERDRPLEAREDPVESRESGQFAMRDADPHPDSGAAEPFTFDQHIVDRALVLATQCRSAPGKLLQSMPLVCRAQLSDHAARGYQIGDIHLSRPPKRLLRSPAQARTGRDGATAGWQTAGRC